MAFKSSPFPAIHRQLMIGMTTGGGIAIEENKRTGERVRVVPGGVNFGFWLGDFLPVINSRKTHPATAAAELAWFLMGTQDLSWLQKYTKIWDGFRETDTNIVSGAYGYRWRDHFRRDQIRDAIQALRDDPSSRRVMISAWDPGEDGLTSQGQRNIPCPCSFTLNIVGGKLHTSMFLRSSDMYVGLPYDVMNHALLLAAFCEELQVPPGYITFTLAHAHMYEKHYHMACEGIEKELLLSPPPLIALNSYSITDIEEEPDVFVDYYKDQSGQARWPEFNPKPELFL